MIIELHHLSFLPWEDEILRDNFAHSLGESYDHRFDEPADYHQFQIQQQNLAFSFVLPEDHLAKISIRDEKNSKISHKIYYTFSAWTTVRGNPSRRNPFLHSGLERFESMRFTTNSSLTKRPRIQYIRRCNR